MEEQKYIYKLVSIANYVILSCLLIEYLHVSSNIMSVSTLTYLLSVFLFSQIVAVPDRSKVKAKILLRNFVLAMLFLGYIHIHTEGWAALPLFYIFTVRVALAAGRRYTALMNLVIITALLALDYAVKMEFSFENLMFSIIHSIFLFIVGLMAQHMLYMIKYEQQQHTKIEELLRQTEYNYKQISESAKKDGLTGLYNHKAFFEYINDVDFRQTAVIMLDIDYFKKFNDKYGHLCGDYVLQELAAVIARSVRNGDVVFRYGGEEFAVILKSITELEIEMVALRIRENVENHVFVYEDKALSKVTVSIGYARGSIDFTNSIELVRCADMSLYMAKDSGRNSVCCNGRMLVGA